MTASSMSNNFRKFEKKSSESSENRILSSTLKAFNSVESILKTTSKRLYNSKSSSSKFDKQTRSIKESENRFNYKDFHREYLIKFKKEAHMYNVFKAFFYERSHKSFKYKSSELIDINEVLNVSRSSSLN